MCVVVICHGDMAMACFFLTNQLDMIDMIFVCFLKNADTPTHIYFNAEKSGLIESGIAFSDENMLVVGKSME